MRPSSVYCPYCNSEAEAYLVHNGIGYEQVSPYHCYECGSYQIGTTFQNMLSPKEAKTGWFEPSRPWWPDPHF